jgi:hypothetical protein
MAQIMSASLEEEESIESGVTVCPIPNPSGEGHTMAQLAQIKTEATKK